MHSSCLVFPGKKRKKEENKNLRSPWWHQSDITRINFSELTNLIQSHRWHVQYLFSDSPWVIVSNIPSCWCVCVFLFLSHFIFREAGEKTEEADFELCWASTWIQQGEHVRLRSWRRGLDSVGAHRSLPLTITETARAACLLRSHQRSTQVLLRSDRGKIMIPSAGSSWIWIDWAWWHSAPRTPVIYTTACLYLLPNSYKP